MKKLSIVLMTGIMVFALAACGSKDDLTKESSVESKVESIATSTTESTAESVETSGEESSEETPVQEAEGATGILTQIWNAHDDSQKFSVFGGTYTQPTMDAPGVFDYTDAESLNSMLGFPAAEADKIDDAASVMHMMNANTFTAGAYHVSSDADVDAVCEAVRSNILDRQWMCGFPDVLVVAKSGNYVISFFGDRELVDNFKTKMQEVLGEVEVVSSDDI